MWSFFRKHPEQQEQRQTTMGTFVKIGSGEWECIRDLDGTEIRIDADDIRGQPDPRLLAYLSEHWQELPALASLARNALYAISDKHHFDMICSSKVGEVCLGFSWEEDAWGETVFVDFRGTKIVTWNSVD
jgi:hypothetical protein